jgi:two-component system cell cycle response regulator
VLQKTGLRLPGVSAGDDGDVLSVIVCEPSGVQRQILSRTLSSAGFQVIAARTAAEALTLIRSGVGEILMTGLELPDSSGFELCWSVKCEPETAHVHTMVLSSHCDVGRLTNALDAGADDFLRKPLVEAEFHARMRAASRIVRLQQRLANEARRDALTGVANRRSFDAALGRALGEASARGTPLSVAILDLDKFKAVNDTWGHSAGDAVLVDIARRARTFAMDGEIFGRLGGEEFAFLLPDQDTEKALTRMDTFRQIIAETPVDIGTNTPLPVTASFGVATLYGAADMEDASGLMDRADTALYAAKDSGRNRVCAG